MIVLNNAVFCESWKWSRGPWGLEGVEEGGRENCRRGWAKLGAARTAQEHWEGERTVQDTHLPSQARLGGSQSSGGLGREALREKMARGNSLDEGGAMENGNSPKFSRG